MSRVVIKGLRHELCRFGPHEYDFPAHSLFARCGFPQRHFAQALISEYRCVSCSALPAAFTFRAHSHRRCRQLPLEMSPPNPDIGPEGSVDKDRFDACLPSSQACRMHCMDMESQSVSPTSP